MAAHLILGSVHDVYDWDWAAADLEQRQALALALSDPSVLALVGRHLMNMGRWDDALKMVNAKVAQDPLNPPVNIALNWIQVRRGRLIEAEAAARRALEISPTHTGAHYYLAIALLARGQRKAAFGGVSERNGRRDPPWRARDRLSLTRAGEWPLRGLQAGPRYRAFLRKMNLPE